MKITRMLKEAAMAVLSAGTTLIIAACYGVYEDYRPGLVSGSVTDSQGLEVPNIEVCAKLPTYEICTNTDLDGLYYLDADQYLHDEAFRSGFDLTARDIDGEQNGRFQDANFRVTAEEMEQAGGMTRRDIVLESIP